MFLSSSMAVAGDQVIKNFTIFLEVEWLKKTHLYLLIHDLNIVH